MSPRRRRNAPVDVDAEEALDLATAQSENVFLFVPNLIGYTRIILAGLSLHFMSYHPIRCTIAYCVSCLLDAVDGHAARALGQTSKFGAVLDMVTDRCVPSPHTPSTIIIPRSDARHPVSCVICPRPIQITRSTFSSLSPSISAVIICTCTALL
ncbi:CDP-alcohol phosphatidyltransferase-domain-containing protein [Mycena leptocephala]|nr:CDP-alcohol phosphatidyltransferase-domain-containing protein [Mycena leptocephala]